MRAVSWEILFLFVGILLISLSTPRYVGEGVRDLRFIPPPPNIERFSFGYAETASDTLWVRILQDIDVCENAPDGVAHRAGEVSTGPKCNKGWVFQMLNAITNLTPQWRLPYVTGGVILSVLVDDIEGATILFDKALARFPNDYNLNYHAAYHFLWEVKSPEKAAPLLLKAAQNGGPAWMYSLAGKLYSESGKLDLAIQVMEDGLKSSRSDRTASRIEARLAELRARKEQISH